MDKFWVSGTGTWTDAAHWSDTSGGAGGAALPTASDTAVFDANSGTEGFVVTIASGTTIGAIDGSACPYSGCRLNFTATGREANLSITGSIKLPPTFEFGPGVGAQNITLNGPTSGGQGVLSVPNYTFPRLNVSGSLRLDAPLSINNAGRSTVEVALLLSGTAVLDTNGKDIVLSAVDETTLPSRFTGSTGAVLSHNASKIRAGRVELSLISYTSAGGYIECAGGSTAATPAISLAAGQYAEDVRLVGVGKQVIVGGGTFGYLTRWLPNGGVSPTMTFDTQSGAAPNFSVTKRLTVHGAQGSRIKFEGVGGAALVSAHLASFNEVDVASISMVGDASPAIVCGGDNLGDAVGFEFPPAALLPLFAAGLA